MRYRRLNRRNVLDASTWAEGHRRYQAIAQLLMRHRGRLTGCDVSDVARELGVSRATLYRLIALYRTFASVEALLPRRPGRRTGTRVLSDAVETIVAAAIAKALPRPTPTRLVERIHARCRDADLPLPHRRTICARLAALGAGAPAVVRSTGERGMGRPPTPDCTTAPRPGDRGRPACSGCLMTDSGRLARRRTG